jgi:chromate transporter
MEVFMKTLFKLFWVFAKIGSVTFGGGYAMMPIIQRELVENRGWATNEEIADYYAIGQCVPGAIAVNTAIFIGNKLGGRLGGIFAALGVVFPSYVIIVIVAAFINNFLHIEAVAHAFAGIRIAVSALIINTVVKLYKTGVKKWFGTAVFSVVLVLSLIFDFSPVYLALGSLLAGLFLAREEVPDK